MNGAFALAFGTKDGGRNPVAAPERPLEVGRLIVANEPRYIAHRRGNMYRLVVLGEHRRRGIGLALVRAGEEHLRRQGASRITALVAYEDEAASAFWQSAGYPQDREIGRRVRNL
jgi:ribosomal protein S18 acetylase RimI-like enzyme